VVMDSLPAHKPGRVREQALLEVLGEALSAVSLRDAWGFFEHAGYHPTAQLP
jgi:hypothetical protein